MTDRRLKPPRLMSKDELAAHMASHHGGGAATLWAHNNAHHMSVSIRHAHRSAYISEESHKDWSAR